MTEQENLFTPDPQPETVLRHEPEPLPTRWESCAEPGCFIAVLTLQIEGEVFCHDHGAPAKG